ncbi:MULTISPECIES: hypothetical protein [Ancylobacter]|uniref:hypothetical protein n=1 Tax=Ancylobacter TaxID=99 RepID=UPI001BCC2A9F|nr:MULTISPECIES: hypothetical protein [Ancylobacter]MBS7587301.1 hypothetical protein [Ancylobacter defluvii]MDR6951974.1 hypothetical protein [Ancylobacter sp. 3268]
MMKSGTSGIVARRMAQAVADVCDVARPEARRRLPTTIGFAAVPDHVRLPARFFGRFTACAVAGLS